MSLMIRILVLITSAAANAAILDHDKLTNNDCNGLNELAKVKSKITLNNIKKEAVNK